ncbi:hypothetical protein ACGGZK_04480 [Agromyces sp. MMS24-K17]|uniref:hypothetical protein n=1 Tax=Agromyces sp. MMS24-K17 TaxID=3372850 RepID=UPI003754A335
MIGDAVFEQSVTALGPLDLASAALSTPLFSFVAAVLIAPLVIVAAKIIEDRRRPAPVIHPEPDTATERYRPERLALSIGAALVIFAFVIETVVRGYLMNLANIVEWWEYATPVFAAVICVTAVLALIVTRGSAPPEQPAPSARRTWTSFGPRAGLIASGATFLALLATTVAAGLESSTGSDGRYIYLELTAPNTSIDPVRPWFYGWAYGVPVLVCLTALAGILWATLHTNAVRPFQRPEYVQGERVVRTEIASGVVRVATAGMLLALAGAWRFIAEAGLMTRLINGETGEEYQTTWRYAEFAATGALLAPILEILAFVLLILVATRMLRTRRPRAGHEEAELDAIAGVAR